MKYYLTGFLGLLKLTNSVAQKRSKTLCGFIFIKK